MWRSILTSLGYGMLLIISVKGARREIKSISINIISLSLNASFCFSLLAIKMNFLKLSSKKIELHLIVINLKSEYSIFGVLKSFSGLEIRSISTHRARLIIFQVTHDYKWSLDEGRRDKKKIER